MRALLLAGFAFASAAHAHPIVAAFERFHRGDTSETAADGGLLLLNELNCVACHAPPAAWRDRLPGRGRISLDGIGARLAPDTLVEFVRDPAGVKPGTAMPQIAATARGDSAALVAYLQSLPAAVARVTFPRGNKERGQHLFETVGCTACHAPAGEPTAYPSVPLVLAPHYDRNALAAFLRDSLTLRPAGRMPTTPLSEGEAADLAEFFGAEDLPSPRAIAPAERTLGRAQFVARNCSACHDTGENITPHAATPLGDLRGGGDCAAAHFDLSPAQISSIAAALQRVRSAPPPHSVADRAREKLEQLNCLACHEWRGRGGLEPPRAKHFTATDGAAESLGEFGRVPPSLDQSGRKLTEAWLEKLLWAKDGGVRPYLSVRMPRFGRENASELPALLSEACRPAQPLEIDTSGERGHQRSATGRTLMGTGPGGLGCVNCHGLKTQEPHGIRAINLTHTATRVRPEYFKALLLDPQHIQPGTIMPPLFTGRASADKEIESIWTYLKELDQSPMLPEGLAIAGAFELKPAEEKRPIIFRTFLEGAGTQAIAVGTSTGVHAAFDAFEVRWALVWRGRFLDAQQNWEERGMKPIRALGEKVVTLPTHMPFANLETAVSPWPDTFGSRAGYSFKGYRVAADGMPTFRYTIGSLSVEDTLRPTPDGTALRRRTVVYGSGAGWYFRGLARGAQPQRIMWENGTAVFEETLSL